MSHYKIKVMLKDGTWVKIRTKPETFEIRNCDGMLALCVGWCPEKLMKSPREYLAVTEAWPGRETLEMTDENDYEVLFSGIVQAAGHDKKVAFLSAREEYGS